MHAPVYTHWLVIFWGHVIYQSETDERTRVAKAVVLAFTNEKQKLLLVGCLLRIRAVFTSAKLHFFARLPTFFICIRQHGDKNDHLFPPISAIVQSRSPRLACPDISSKLHHVSRSDYKREKTPHRLLNASSTAPHRQTLQRYDNRSCSAILPPSYWCQFSWLS